VARGLVIKGFAFDVDILTALLDARAQVIEVPIDWHDEPGGHVHLIRDSLRMFNDVVKIRAARKARCL
jgi:hypothetical protein